MMIAALPDSEQRLNQLSDMHVMHNRQCFSSAATRSSCSSARLLQAASCTRQTKQHVGVSLQHCTPRPCTMHTWALHGSTSSDGSSSSSCCTSNASIPGPTAITRREGLAVMFSAAGALLLRPQGAHAEQLDSTTQAIKEAYDR